MGIFNNTLEMIKKNVTDYLDSVNKTADTCDSMMGNRDFSEFVVAKAINSNIIQFPKKSEMKKVING